jgi:uncharacterized membrane protein
MTLSSLLIYVSAALVLVAFIFFMIGFARSGWPIGPLLGRTGQIDGTELTRLRAVQRADWKCGAGLLGVALVAYVTNRLGTGKYFNEPSGNISGGVLLISAVVGLVIVVALIVRHVTLLHALRKLERRHSQSAQ